MEKTGGQIQIADASIQCVTSKSWGCQTRHITLKPHLFHYLNWKDSFEVDVGEVPQIFQPR